jgi:major intracellular serine protease
MIMSSWGAEYIGAPSFYPRSTGKGRIAAVVDTGVDASHRLLSGRVIGGSVDFTDTDGHGTHVAGIIASIAPDCRILAVKIDACGGLPSAIRCAVDGGADVINVSYSTLYNNVGLQSAVQYAIDAGVPIVAASGNNGDGRIDTDEYVFPGGDPRVIEVGAIDRSGKIAAFTNTNANLTCLAPGVDVESSSLYGNFVTLSGTSQAAPHVTAAALLIRDYAERALGRRLSVDETRAYLRQCTRYGGYPWPILDLSAPFDVAEPDFDAMDIRDTIRQICEKSCGRVIDTPEFWVNLAEKYDRGETITREDFRYVALFMKKANYYGIPK